MTIGQKNKCIVDENAPLLPSTQTELQDIERSNGGSFAGSVFNLSTTIIGAGIMALPAVMKTLGLVPGILLILFFAYLSEASIEFLIRFSRVGRATSYGAVMEDAFGKLGKFLLQIVVIVNNVGILVVYMIVIGDVLSGTSAGGDHHIGVLEGWFGQHWFTGRLFVLLVTMLAVFAPLACFKRIDSLSSTSAISVALAVVFVVITAGIAIYKIFAGKIQMPKLFPSISDSATVWNLFTVVPVLVTSFVCHYNVHPIANELYDSSQIKPVARTSLFLCSMVYIATSFFAYLLFGESTLTDVLANFDSNLGIPYSSTFNNIVRVSYAVHLMLVFPMIFHSLRLYLDGVLFPSAKPLSSDNRRFTIMTIGLLLIIFLTANFVPSIWDAFQFTGATATVFIGFIFPAAITLRDSHGTAKNWDKILSVIMIVLAAVSNVIAIYSDAYSLFNKGKGSPKSVKTT